MNLAKTLVLPLAACAVSVCGLAADPGGENGGQKIASLGETPVVDDKGVMTITKEGVYNADGGTIDGCTGHTTTSCLDVQASATIANGTYKFGGMELTGDDVSLTIAEDATLSFPGTWKKSSGLASISTCSDNKPHTLTVCGALDVSKASFIGDSARCAKYTVIVDGGTYTGNQTSNGGYGFKSLTVKNGGTFTVPKYFISHQNLDYAELIVSNGTFKTTNGGWGMWGKGQVTTIMGKTGKIDVDKLDVNGGSSSEKVVIKFVIPEGGYDAGFVPFTSKANDFKKNMEIQVDASAVELDAEPVTYTLVTVGSALSLTADYYAALFSKEPQVDGYYVREIDVNNENLKGKLMMKTDRKSIVVELSPKGAHEHQFEGEETTPATCEGKGVMTYTCTAEGCTEPPASYTQEIPALGHAYGEWEILSNATCTVVGARKHTCTREGCGKEEVEVIAALGHDWGEWVVIREPTAEARGEKKHICQREGCGAEETAEIPRTSEPQVDEKGVLTLDEGRSYNAYGETIDGYTGHEKTSCLNVTTNATLENGIYRFGAMEIKGVGAALTIAEDASLIFPGTWKSPYAVSDGDGLAHDITVYGTLDASKAGSFMSKSANAAQLSVTVDGGTFKPGQQVADAGEGFASLTVKDGGVFSVNKYRLLSYGKNATVTLDNAKMMTSTGEGFGFWAEGITLTLIGQSKALATNGRFSFGGEGIPATLKIVLPEGGYTNGAPIEATSTSDGVSFCEKCAFEIDASAITDVRYRHPVTIPLATSKAVIKMRYKDGSTNKSKTFVVGDLVTPPVIKTAAKRITGELQMNDDNKTLNLVLTGGTHGLSVIIR